MKESLKSLIIAAMAAVSLFSCSKSGDEPIPVDPPAESKVDAMIYIAVSEQQTSFFEQAYEFKVNGTSVEFSLSQMTAVDTAAAPKAFKTKIYNAIAFMDGVSAPIRNFKVYSYKLGTLTSGQKVEGVQKTWTVKSQRPEQETVDIMSASYIGSDDGAKPSINNPHIEASLHCGVFTDDTSLTGFAKLLSKSISSITVEL